jgi:hypothetical protein
VAVVVVMVVVMVAAAAAVVVVVAVVVVKAPELCKQAGRQAGSGRDPSNKNTNNNKQDGDPRDRTYHPWFWSR